MFDNASLVTLISIFIVAGGVVVVTAIKATYLADIIADRTSMGEAMVGGVVLGAATSLAGVVVSVNAALSGEASYAFSNAVGGIAAQTLFLALADMLYRKANLEHAAAEPESLFQAILLIILLSLPLCAVAGPDLSFWSVHPVSPLILIGYIWGLKLSASVRDVPMWRPVETDETHADEPDAENDPDASVLRPALIFAGLVAVMGVGGYVIGQIGGQFITRFGLQASLVGALMTALVTSLPEFVTTLTAVRHGALQLAVGGIIGGNTFDTLFLVASDVAYRDGSLYHAVGPADLYWLGTGLLMTAVLLAGLILRQREGPGRIGVESVTLMGAYGAAVALAVLR